MSKRNKFGLSRYIPDKVRRKIRKDAGFGCVICGYPICQYDHIDPEFEIAKTHNPSKMTLLCGSCHDKKSRGQISKELVFAAKNSPRSKEKGFVSDFFDFGGEIPIICLGKQKFINTPNLIHIEGVPILYFKIQSLGGNQKTLLNAVFYNDLNEPQFIIEDNVWYSATSVWDLEIKGTFLTIRDSEGSISLKVEIKPRKEFIVHHINMNFKGYQLIGNSEKFIVITPSGKQIIALSNEVIASGYSAIKIQNEELILRNISFHSGEIDLRNSGAEFCYFGKETKVII